MEMAILCLIWAEKGGRNNVVPGRVLAREQEARGSGTSHELRPASWCTSRRRGEWEITCTVGWILAREQEPQGAGNSATRTHEADQRREIFQLHAK
jgi:hypothetical protein